MTAPETILQPASGAGETGDASQSAGGGGSANDSGGNHGRQGSGGGSSGGGTTTTKTSLLDSLAGQATAAIAVLAAIVYGSGGLTLGLKLWFFRLSWTPVLGQLPHDFILVTAVGQILLPCIIIGGLAGYVVHNFGRGRAKAAGQAQLAASADGAPGSDQQRRWPRQLGLAALVTAGSAAAGAVLGLLPIGVLLFSASSAGQHHRVQPGLLQSYLSIYVFCSIASTVTVLVAVVIIRWIRQSENRRTATGLALTIAMTSFALVPGMSSVAAAYLLPPVELCAPNFVHPVTGHEPSGGYMAGNLIGSNSQWAYIAQFTLNSANAVTNRTITAVPISAIRLEAIGAHSGCGDLTTTTG